MRGLFFVPDHTGSHDFFDDPEFMGVGVLFFIKYACLVQTINANFSVRMQDVIVLHDKSYMGNAAFGIVKKSQITRTAFFDKA